MPTGTHENPKSPKPIPGQINPEVPTQGPHASELPVGLENLPELIDHPRYRVIELLGTGGMGAVFKAEHRLMERLVALKVISRSLIVSATAMERFRLEVKAAARLTHPNIVAAYDAEQAGDVHFLVMEFVEGTSLAQVGKRGPLPIASACDYILQAALGLQHAHEQGMVHRDIKPHNLMLTSKGRIKILDFGLARFVSERGTQANLTAQGVVMGTPDYIAPEQAEDARQANIRADIYGLGCTLYFLLTGQPPFPKGTSMQKILAHIEEKPPRVYVFRDDVPGDLIRILDRMMEKKPEDRFQTPVEVARVLGPLIKGTSSGIGVSAPKPVKAELDPTPVKAVPSLKPVEVTPRVSDSKAATQTRSGGLRIRGPGPRKGKRSKTTLVRHFIRRHWAVLIPVVALVLALAFLVYYKLKNKVFPDTPGRIAARAKWIQIDSFRKHNAAVSSVAFSPDGKRVASGDETGKIVLRDFSKKNDDSLELKRHTRVIRSLSFSTSGTGLLSGSDDTTMLLWDVETGKVKETFPHRDSVYGVAWNQWGLFSITKNGFFHEWNLKEGKEKLVRYFPIGVNMKLASCWSISPNGTKVAFGDVDGNLWYCELNNPYKPIPLLGNYKILNCLVFSNDSTFLLSGGTYIRLWDLPNQKLVRTLSGHSGQVNSLAFSPYNDQVLSGSEDKTVRLWDITTGDTLFVFDGHTEGVTAVAFSPDGKRIVSGSKDKTVRFWEPVP